MSEVEEGQAAEAAEAGDSAEAPGAAGAGPANGSSGPLPAGTAASVLEYVARAIVDEPDSVRVEVDEGRNGLTLRLHVAQGDMGMVIGRRGRVAQAIRALVRAAGSRDGADVQVDIVD